MNTRTLCGLAASVTTLAVLAGCSDTGPANSASPPASAQTAAAPTPAPGAPSDPGAAHNAADAAFVQGMIPHHRQAVAMSELAATRAASPEVKDLAGRISAAQGPEIEQMNRLLTAWGMPPGGPGMPGMGAMPGMGPGAMNGMSGMSGMMSPDHMRGLETATGSGFDRMFLQMMIEHHTGAIQTARTELAGGQNPEAKQLAQAIIDAQQTEITQMQVLLGRV